MERLAGLIHSAVSQHSLAAVRAGKAPTIVYVSAKVILRC